MAAPADTNSSWFPLLAGSGYALLTLCATAVTASLLLAFTGFQEESLDRWMYILHALSALFGGFSASRRSGSKGWYFGGLTGILYAFIVLLTGFLALDASFGSHTAIVAAVAAGSGAAGGVVGVNFSKK
jgi:putative membrane protein (TIGR04086 family)